jgi:predicted lipoprotein with Yx(FWY)xxD motif
MDDAGMCAGVRPQLGVYLTGAIAPADRVVVVRHLAACAGCRAELAELAGLPALLRRPPVQAAAQEPTTDNTEPDITVTYYPDADYPGPGNTDAGYPGPGYPDAGYPGPGYPDAGYRDAGHPDAGYPDAGYRGLGYPDGMPGRLVRSVARRRRRRRWLLVAAALVLVVTAGSGWALHLLSPSAPGPQAEATMLQTRTIRDVTVLTDDEGYTLYWFGPDSANKSDCQGSCARSWPPVTGPATWGPGVSGAIGAIVRPGGALQATYDGHPLYTTTADTGPGQNKGNGVWSHGGEWHEVTVPGQGG